MKFTDVDGNVKAEATSGTTLHDAILAVIDASKMIGATIELIHNGRTYKINGYDMPKTIQWAFENGAEYALKNGHA